VTSRITQRRWTGSTALLSQRRSLLNEAEEYVEPFDASTSLLPLQQRYRAAFCRFDRAFVSKTEAVFATGSLKWSRTIDEKDRINNIVFVT
jgi:hypothetical protein